MTGQGASWVTGGAAVDKQGLGSSADVDQGMAGVVDGGVLVAARGELGGVWEVQVAWGHVSAVVQVTGAGIEVAALARLRAVSLAPDTTLEADSSPTPPTFNGGGVRRPIAPYLLIKHA